MKEISMWILGGFLALILSYIFVRVLSKGIFKSYYEAKKEEMNGYRPQSNETKTLEADEGEY